MLRTSPLRVLDDRDLPAVTDLLDRDPVTDVFVGSRVALCGLDPWRLGAELWGYAERGELVSICYAGANLVPVQATEAAVHAFADRARRQGRRCSSIVGPADAVDPLWRLLEPSWGTARAVRSQPHMVATRPPPHAGDPAVRRVREDEVEIVLPACVAMFTEEVGLSPVAGDGGTLYRSRVAELVRQGRGFARIEGGTVIFKAEIAAVTRRACQVQGVWVPPSHRGRGIAAAGIAAVVTEAMRSIAPAVSLYVNDYNAPARAAYRRAGFVENGRFMSVLF
ncbi:MAG: GNAT family N-acetyltransferase [Streptosporangiales bacterium]|nr:GNAT family N-acetyltransferase [Streptosporangiales bacterium]